LTAYFAWSLLDNFEWNSGEMGISLHGTERLMPRACVAHVGSVRGRALAYAWAQQLMPPSVQHCLAGTTTPPRPLMCVRADGHLLMMQVLHRALGSPTLTTQQACS